MKNEVSGLVSFYEFERRSQGHNKSWSEHLDTNAEGGFAGVAKLQSHYRQQQKVSSRDEQVFLSQKRLEKFKENYNHYQKRNPKLLAPSTLLGWMSSKWVLFDSGCYQTRLNDLAKLVQRLDNIVPAEYLTKLRLAEGDINPNWSTDLPVFIQRAAYSRSNAFVEMIDLELKKRCEQKILRRLSFQEMKMRKDSITSPFVTLGWALSTKATRQRWDLLPLYLQSESGIYWLCGKAGSGKSTLMKLLSDHELEDLFRDMLTRVDKRYLLQAARILKVCKLYTAQYIIGVPTLGLAQLDWHDYNSSRLAEALKYGFSIIEKETNCNRIEGRLRSRCGGLLELRRSNRLPQRFCFCGQFNFGGYNTCHEDFDTDSVIVFMHRSVFDFLDMEETWELDCLDLGAEHEFDEQAAVGCLSLHLAHCSANQNNNSHFPSQCIEHIYDAWRRALWANWKTGTQIMRVVAAFVDVLRMAQSARRWASDYPWGDFPPEKIMLRLAVEAGMLDLIERFRDKNPSLDTLEGCYPLLFHATNPVFPTILSQKNIPKRHYAMCLYLTVSNHVARWLLSLGYCTNESFTSKRKIKLLPGNIG